MTGPAPRWWGWAEPAHPPRLPGAGLALLRAGIGLPEGARGERVELEQVELPESALPQAALRRLRDAVGEENVRAERIDRVVHAAGKSYPDLIRLRSGDASMAPDAVVFPGSAEEVAAVLAACADEGVAVVPFGGGTSVVGGVEPLRGPFGSVVTLDLGRIDGLSVDRRSLLATFGAGLRGPAAEARLASRGLTLGHFPQSYEFASIGGYVATRSAGQASTGYGRIDEMVRGVRLVAPAGELVVKPFPASAAGPAMRELVVGSEGALGVITEATLSVRPLPAERRYEGWSFRSFAEGTEAFRLMEQAHASPDVARLSDEEETRLTLALASSGSLAERAGRAYLRARGHEGGCIAIVGFEGDEREVGRRAGVARETLRGAGGLPLGSRPGEAWLRGRYSGPYMRDELLDRGVMVETLETAATWTDLHGVHDAVAQALRGALAARGTPALVGCHVSHLYPSGASLYFTWIARQERGAELEQWRAAKTAACDAIVASGGTITHHHAVGRDHAPWLRAEIGDLGVDVLRAAKQRLDPAGIMNPGKLLPGI
ncbi:MAG: alkyldihydroxyacetonephosphate synthase [Thermoleophilaceae bacterium]|nr:alkyldihydroxyacetonephosphate synthase [Thermoleophilaceae bacterium]